METVWGALLSFLFVLALALSGHVEAPSKEQIEQFEKAEKERSEQIEKAEKERKEQKEKAEQKEKPKQKEKSKQKDRTSGDFVNDALAEARTAGNRDYKRP